MCAHLAPVLALVALPVGVMAAAPQHSVTFTQIVNQADPGLTWNPPASIPFGTALGLDQLTATTRTPGIFTYTPPLGTIPKPGLQTLSVTFSPADKNYHKAQTSVPIAVIPPGDSGFSVSFSPPLPGGNRIIVSPEGEATLRLIISPTGDFHQPVSLSCSSSQDIQCVFSPETMRPTTAPLAATLNLRWSALRHPDRTQAGVQGAFRAPFSTPVSLRSGLLVHVPGEIELYEQGLLAASLVMLASLRLRRPVAACLYGVPRGRTDRFDDPFLPPALRLWRRTVSYGEP